MEKGVQNTRGLETLSSAAKKTESMLSAHHQYNQVFPIKFEFMLNDASLDPLTALKNDIQRQMLAALKPQGVASDNKAKIFKGFQVYISKDSHEPGP